MSGTWELTPIEFWVAWETLGRDRMPFPLTFAAEVETQVEFDLQRRAAADALLSRMGSDDSLYHALHALAHADVRIELFGYRYDGRDRMIRACAARESTNGVVAAQIPGPNFGDGGNIRVDLRPAHAIVSRLLSVLPDVPAGSGTPIDMHRNDLNRPPRPNSHRRSAPEQAIAFLQRPYRTYAELRVVTGPALDGWHEGGTRLHVIDYRNDGRYLIHDNERVQVIPATPKRLHIETTRLLEESTTKPAAATWPT
ncbi:ESX secretion-associated protein EspG [Nocardia sp. NPDC127579]|uniref:ESX secretion-associated protein EspG n=1 Tax=Nocardia sp. NPDC127579 TaxID=3345402 RepID=UPI003634F2BB